MFQRFPTRSSVQISQATSGQPQQHRNYGEPPEAILALISLLARQAARKFTLSAEEIVRQHFGADVLEKSRGGG